jgi:hypothetical protein
MRWWRRVTGLAFFVILALVRAASADVERDAAELQAEGVRLFQTGELLRARTAFIAARALVEDRAGPHRWLGLVDARLGRCADAIASLETFLRKVPSSDVRVPEVVAERDRCRRVLEAQTAAPEPPRSTARGPVEERAAMAPVASVAPSAPRPALVDQRGHRRLGWHRWWLWTTVGLVSAGALALGLGFGLHAGSDLDAVHVH